MYKDEFRQKAWKLPASDLLYVGRSTNQKLLKIGIKTIGDLAKMDEHILVNHLGKMGSVLWAYIRCGICGKGLCKYGNKSSYRCHNGHVSRIRGKELEAALLDIARNMALSQLQEFELKTNSGNCPDNLEREIESLKKSKAYYAKLKFEIYDDYTKENITRDQIAKKTAEVKQKIAEIESLITEKQETLDMQKDLFLDAKQEQLTKLSKLDEFDEEVIRYLIDYVLVYDNEHIEIRWNFDDFQAG